MSYCGGCRSNTHTFRNISYFIGKKLTTGKSAHTLWITVQTVPSLISVPFLTLTSPDGQNLVLQM